MSKVALPLAMIAFTGAIVSLLALLVSGEALGMWVMFPMQVLVIVSFANALRQVRKHRIRNYLAIRPSAAAVPLVVAVLVGAGMMMTNILSGMPRVSPSGESVHAYSANATGGECRATYNKVEHAVLPMKACDDMARHMSLAFNGAWLLFGAISLWFAMLVKEPRLEGAHGV